VVVRAQSTFLTQHAAHLAYQAAVHVAVQSTTHIARNAAILELADRFVGEMSEQLVGRLGLPSKARRVLISAETQRHAIARRAISSQLDAELVASRIAEAFANVQYQLMPQRDPGVFELVGRAESADRWLLLPLKLVPSTSPETQNDELWIRTAVPFGKTKFRQAQAKGLLRNLSAEKPSNPSFKRTA
jgi:hypothetical protein